MALLQFADAGRLKQAYILSSPQRSEGVQAARRLAAAAVCTSGGAVPCMKCRGCRKALEGIHPDVIALRRFILTLYALRRAEERAEMHESCATGTAFVSSSLFEPVVQHLPGDRCGGAAAGFAVLDDDADGDFRVLVRREAGEPGGGTLLSVLHDLGGAGLAGRLVVCLPKHRRGTLSDDTAHEAAEC